MKDVLSVEIEQNLTRPLNYHQRTEHKIIENSSQVEQKLKDIEDHASQNGMKINQKKTKLMLFNTSTKYDFQPYIEVNGDIVEVVSKMTLLGVIVTDNLKWY